MMYLVSSSGHTTPSLPRRPCNQLSAWGGTVAAASLALLVQSRAAHAANRRETIAPSADDFRNLYPYTAPRDFLNYILQAVPSAGDPSAVQDAMDAFSAVYPMYAVGRRKAAVLERVLRERECKQCLEIGSFFGYSAISIAKTMGHDAELTCFEGNGENIEVMRGVLRHAFGNDGEVLGRIHIVEGLSTASLMALAPNPARPYDFVFLDHDKNCYLKDFTILEEKGLLDASSCTLVADNVIFPGAPDYLEYLGGAAAVSWDTRIEKLPFERIGFETQFKERQDGMSVSLRRRRSGGTLMS